MSGDKFIYDQWGPMQPKPWVQMLPEPATIKDVIVSVGKVKFVDKPKVDSEKKSTWDSQIGGSHYKNFKIQPSEYIYRNGFDWYDSNSIKYVSRHKFKNGALDLKKSIQYIQAQLEASYGIKSTVTYEG